MVVLPEVSDEFEDGVDQSLTGSKALAAYWAVLYSENGKVAEKILAWLLTETLMLSREVSSGRAIAVILTGIGYVLGNRSCKYMF